MTNEELIERVTEAMCEKSIKALNTSLALRNGGHVKTKQLVHPDQIEPFVREVVATLQELGVLQLNDRTDG
jgi:hypothetical protein